MIPARSEFPKAVAFDLDGTLYFGDAIADGAQSLVRRLRSLGVAVLFFTNNSAKTRSDVVQKLVGMGLPATAANTYTSGAAVAAYLRERELNRAAVLGTRELRTEIALAGIEVTVDSADAEVLVVGFIPGFDFGIRPRLLARLPEGLPIVACNMDMTYPVENGERRPGCGAIVRAVEAWAGRDVDAIVGKPNTFMLEMLCRDQGLRPHDVLVVGDNVASDVAMAQRAGSPWVLVGQGAEVPDGGTVVSSLRELQTLIDQTASQS